MTILCRGEHPVEGCGRALTVAEARYYGHCCEACMRRWDARMQAWRNGADDPFFDAMFSVPPE